MFQLWSTWPTTSTVTTTTGRPGFSPPGFSAMLNIYADDYRNNNNNDNSNNQVNTNIANSANDQDVMGGAGMGRDVRLLERIWATITGQDTQAGEEDSGVPGEHGGGGGGEINRKRIEERGLELMRELLRKRQMEDHQTSSAAEDNNSGYPPGLH